MRTYYNNNQHLNQPMNEETVFHHHSKRNQFLILSTFFCYYYCCTFSCIFFRWLFFPSKHIKVMFKVFKLILNINIEGKVCSHHTVQFCETEQKPIGYDVNMALMMLTCSKFKKRLLYFMVYFDSSYFYFFNFYKQGNTVNITSLQI